MIYYLIAETNEDAICLVKNTNENNFRQQWADKIVYSSLHIIELLPKISLTSTGKYSFSLN
jgi:hypothetical protein